MSIKKSTGTTASETLAICLPHIGAVSETFITRQIKLLAPQKTVLVTGNIIDNSWSKHPTLVVPFAEIGSRFHLQAEQAVKEFFKTHGVTRILCEYGCYGTEMVELNQREMKLPIFVHFHGGDASVRLREPNVVDYYQWMGQCVNGVIAVSKQMAGRLVEIGIPEEKIFVNPYGVEIPQQGMATPQQEPCRLLCISRLVPKKAPLQLLKAFERAYQQVPSLRLDIIGDGPLKEVTENYIATHGLQNAVTLHGAKPYSFVQEMLSQSSVYVQHSVVDPRTGDAEGLPNSILEAASYQLPIVSTFHEGIPDAVEHGTTGFLVREFDYQQMAEYIVQLAKDPERRAKMGSAGREKITREFCLDLTISKLQNFIGLRQADSESPSVPFQASPKLSFMQVHMFYETYLQSFYQANQALASQSFEQQIEAIVRDGFSGIHMLAPYMRELGYDAELIIANNHFSQLQWMKEHNGTLADSNNWQLEIVKQQIESIKPDILYLSEPLSLDGKFLRQLSYKPKLVLGWRAANIPQGTDWSGFDIILSSLEGIREAALMIGSRWAEHFWPGFPLWMYDEVKDIQPEYDIMFSGQWTQEQHIDRNRYLDEIAQWSQTEGREFSCAYYLSGQTDTLTPAVEEYQLGPRFGLGMYQAIRSGRIAFDARGSIGIQNQPGHGQAAHQDLAKNQTANMRIFEVTGCGAFLLTEHRDNLHELFTPGVEVETFRDKRELEAKILFYVQNPAQREEIAARGRERCHREHSMQARTTRLDQIIREYLERKLAPSMAVAEVSEPKNENPGKEAGSQKMESTEIEATIDYALQRLREGDHQAALTQIIAAKRYHMPVRFLDQARAICFVEQEKWGDAKQALLEELRHFPDNTSAQSLLDEVEQQYAAQSQNGALLHDAEFQELLATIRPYSMLPEARLYSLFSLAKEICLKGIPGNIVECGVAGGGSTALLAAVVKRYSKVGRKVFACDSFEGMPEPSEHDQLEGVKADDTGWGTGTCAAPEDSVREISQKLGVEDFVETIKGYFEETLPATADTIGAVALLHIDCDWYESTKAVLDTLFDRISTGGVCQVDDYGYWEGMKKAVDEFEQVRNISFQMNSIDGLSAWFSK